jgi:tetratricopeptide (TPR) repeat protein
MNRAVILKLFYIFEMLKNTLHFVYKRSIIYQICLWIILVYFLLFPLYSNTYCPIDFFNNLKIYKKNILSKAGKLRAEALAEYGNAYSEIRKKRKFTEESESKLLHSLQANPYAETPLKLLLAIWSYKLQYENIEKYLLPLAEKHPKAFALNLRVSNYLIEQKKYKKALSLLLKSFNHPDLSSANTTKIEKLVEVTLAISKLYLKINNVEQGEEFWDNVLSHKVLSQLLLIRIAAVEFFAEYADKGPDGFFAGWSKRRYKRKMNENILIFEKLWNKNKMSNALVLRPILKVFKRYNMFENGENLLLFTLLRNPYNSTAILLLAKYYYDFKLYMMSELTWQKIINSNYYPNAGLLWKYIVGRDEADFYFQLGNAAFYAEDYKEALRAFNWYLLLHPDSMRVKFKLGLVYMKYFDYSNARNAFRKIKDVPSAAYYAGLCSLYLMDFPEAYDFFVKAEKDALKLKMKDFLNERFYLHFAVAADKSKNYEKAENILINLFNKSPYAPEICNFLAYLWIEKGINLDKAEIIIKRALKKDPKNVAYLDTYAWLFYKLKKYKKAKTYILKAIKFKHELSDAVIYEHAGDIFAAIGENSKAIKYWVLALSIYSDEIDSDALKDKIDYLKDSQLDEL